MTINQRLNIYVAQKGLKQSYIAQRSGMSADTISKILNSNRRITAEEFLVLCEVLQIDPNIFRN